MENTVLKPSDSIYSGIIEHLETALAQASLAEADKLLESTLTGVGLTAHDLVPPMQRERLPDFATVAQIIAFGRSNIEQNFCKGWAKYRKSIKDLAKRYQESSDFINQIDSSNFSQLPQLARTMLPMRNVIRNGDVVDFPFQSCEHCRFASGTADKDTNPSMYTKTGLTRCLLLERGHEDFLRRISGKAKECVFSNLQAVNASKKYLSYVAYHYASMYDELSFRLEFVVILAEESSRRELGHIAPALESHQAPQ